MFYNVDVTAITTITAINVSTTTGSVKIKINNSINQAQHYDAKWLNQNN